MTYHAQIIVTNNPSKDSVGGLAIFNNNDLTTVLVTSRLLDRIGKLGILRAITSGTSESYLDDNHLDAPSKCDFDKLCSQMAERLQLANRFDAASLSQ